MRSELATFGAALAALTGSAVFALSTGPQSATAPSHSDDVHTLTLTLRYGDAAFQFVGKDPDHPVMGDEFIDSAPVRAHGKVAGRFNNICTIVSGSSEATFITQCAGTFTLPQGEITTSGADDSSDRTTDAVTGGTGAFSHVTGTATTVSGSDAATVTIHYADAH
jgi:hypothetical protein